MEQVEVQIQPFLNPTVDRVSLQCRHWADGGEEKRVQGFGEGKNHWEDPGVDGSSGSGLWVYGLD
jgi:hypothetical protein